MNIIQYDDFKNMWLNITHEQRHTLKQAYVDRYQRRIDIKDTQTIECVNEVITAKKPTTAQVFMLYVAAISDKPENWFFTRKAVYYSPAPKIYTGYK